MTLSDTTEIKREFVFNWENKSLNAVYKHYPNDECIAVGVQYNNNKYSTIIKILN